MLYNKWNKHSQLFFYEFSILTGVNAVKILKRPPERHSVWTLSWFLTLNSSFLIKDRCDSYRRWVLLTFSLRMRFQRPQNKKQVQLSLAVMKTEVKPFWFWQSKLWWVYCADRQMWTSACRGLWAHKSEGRRNTTFRQWQREKKEVMGRERKGVKREQSKAKEKEGQRGRKSRHCVHDEINIQGFLSIHKFNDACRSKAFSIKLTYSVKLVYSQFLSSCTMPWDKKFPFYLVLQSRSQIFTHLLLLGHCS